FHYEYSIYQAEYSRNLLFVRGAQMEQVFQRMVDRTRARLDVRQVRTLFGTARRPHWHWKRRPRLEVVLETPVYDLTVFKLHFGKLTLKAYTPKASTYSASRSCCITVKSSAVAACWHASHRSSRD